MKKEKIKTVEQVIEEIKATPKNNRTIRQQKILKTNKISKVLTCATYACSALPALGLLLMISSFIYGIAAENHMEHLYKAEIDQHKAQQIEKLTEEYDGGKGFSAKEYLEKVHDFENSSADYFAHVASQDVKAEYEQINSNAYTMLLTGAGAGLGGFALFAAGVVTTNTVFGKRDKYLQEEYSARETQGKEKEL